MHNAANRRAGLGITPRRCHRKLSLCVCLYIGPLSRQCALDLAISISWEDLVSLNTLTLQFHDALQAYVYFSLSSISFQRDCYDHRRCYKEMHIWTIGE